MQAEAEVIRKRASMLSPNFLYLLEDGSFGIIAIRRGVKENEKRHTS
jgi:hypothetical protein